jgi:Tetratricopeptide repeat
MLFKYTGRWREAVRLYARGHTEDALALYCRALAIKQRLLGRTQPDVAVTLNNLAVLTGYLGPAHQTGPRPVDARALL